MTGLYRMALNLAMYSAHRTSVRPPQVTRRPLNLPLSQLSGATPANFPIFLWLSEPSSGNAEISTAWVTGPIPLHWSINFSLLAKCVFNCVCTSLSMRPISFLSTSRTASILLCWAFGLINLRLSSATRISTSWRRRTIMACNAISCKSGRRINNCSRLSEGYRVWAKWLNTRASIASVLARCPMDLAKSWACRGLTTMTGNLPIHNATAAECSKPPVASRTTAPGVSGAALIAAINAAIPCSSLAKFDVLLLSSRANSNLSFDTSIPTKIISEAFIITPPCKYEVVTRTTCTPPATVRALDKRLILHAMSSRTGLVTQGGNGLCSIIRNHPATSIMHYLVRLFLPCAEPINTVVKHSVQPYGFVDNRQAGSHLSAKRFPVDRWWTTINPLPTACPPVGGCPQAPQVGVTIQ